MATLLTTSTQRNDSYVYPHLAPLLGGLFGGITFICICGLVWCFIRRRKHRAPVIPYSMHTLSNSTQRPPEGAEGNESSTKRPKPAKFGTHGRGVGYGFNPISKEPYGGGGGQESGIGPVAVIRAGTQYG